MSGFEVAGILLAVLPIVVQALQSASKGRVVFGRKRHIDKLIHELQEQQACLALTIRALFVKSGVTEFSEDWEELPGLLRDRHNIREAVEDFLEPKVFGVYEHSLKQCERAVSEIARRIGGVCGGDLTKGAEDLEQLLQANSAASSEAKPFKALKLLLRKDEIDEAIRHLRDAVIGLGNLQKLVEAGNTALTAGGSPSSTKAKQLAKTLSRARDYANSLYSAIARSWSPTCSQNHTTELFLESRLALTQPARQGKERNNEKLKYEALIHCTAETTPALAWHETCIELLEEDPPSAPISTPPPAGTMRVAVGLPAVTFTGIHQSQQTQLTLNDVVDLCELTKQASMEQKVLRLYYLLQRSRMQFGDSQHSCVATPAPRRSATLAELLTVSGSGGDRTRRIPLKDRMLLALALSLNMLQLQETPWLSEPWSKNDILFPEKPRVAANVPGISAGDFDTTRPFILRKFATRITTTATSLPPRKALQDFAVVLLELWHETSLELQFGLTTTPSSGDRLSLALDWLDYQMNPPPDQYRQAVSQCLQPHFSTVSGILSWDDLQFQHAICQFVINPLVKICEQWSY